MPKPTNTPLYTHLTEIILNDNAGYMCGKSYYFRCRLAQEKDSAAAALEWLKMATSAYQWLSSTSRHYAGQFSANDILLAAFDAADFYRSPQVPLAATFPLNFASAGAQ